MRRVLLVLCATFAAAPALSESAHADVFESIQLASASASQQADFARHPAISGDARYVAFDGSFGGRIGVWRRDLLTRAVAPVVTCPEGTSPEAPCVELPSISRDGRYVSVTTTMALDPKNDANAAPDVYVRDMNSSTVCSSERPEGEDCEYRLASAKSGSSHALSYSYGANPAFEEPHYGSLASGRSALSADGRYAAFVTTAESDLHGEHTPTLQVAVRDLATRVTTLVSVRYDAVNRATSEEPVPAGPEGLGAAYPGGAATPVFGFAGAAFAGASISADGSTVAWVGQQIDKQAPALSSEALAPGYTEPLWRRIADGPLAPVRRITGGGDPASPACAASGEGMTVQPPTLADPCQGPFDPTYSEGTSGIWVQDATAGDYLPRLSANGLVVAFLATAREVASGESFRASEASDDLYVVDMRSGLTRVQALRKLTQLAGGSRGETARNAAVVDLGLSPDGSEVAFDTQRTVFPLGSPAFVSAPAAAVGMVELFNVDLANDTLTRVTQGFQGQPSEPTSGLSGSPSFSADGNTLSFSSTGTNLVYGDGNSPHGEASVFDGSDAFVVRRKVLTPTPAETYISAAPGAPPLAPVWRLDATARSRRDGSVVLDVLVPGAGSVSARASGAVALPAPARGRSRRRPRVKVVQRTVAGAKGRSAEAGVIELILKLARPYDSLALRRGGFSASTLLSFSAPGHPDARTRVDVAFARTIKSPGKAAKHGHRARRSKPGARR